MAADVVHQGYLHKLGGNVKSWTKRWMILKKDNVLYYYKDSAKSPQGSVPLSDHMFQAKEGRERDLNWPKSVAIERTIVLRTSYRIYYMYAETQQVAAEWIERLQSTADSIPGRKARRVEPKPNLPSEVPATNVVQSHPKTPSVSSNLCTSVDTVESIYDAAKQPDSDCSISTDEENGPGPNDDYAVPPSSELADDDAIYELTDDNLSHSLPSKSLTTPAPMLPVKKSSSVSEQPIYEDADKEIKPPPDEVYETVNDQQPPWAASRHIPPSDPPPPPPDDDDDDDEDTVPLPPPSLPPKESDVPPPVPSRGSSSSKITNGIDDSPPAVPSKKKAAASSPKATSRNGDYSLLDKIEKPPLLSTSPPPMMQKARIDSAVSGTISPTEIDSLKYEPEEDSEEFYVDMAANDDSVNEDRQLEAQRQRELEEQQLEEQRQLQRQRDMEQELDSATLQDYDGTKRLSQVELEAQQQAEYEARMRKEMEDKKKERLDYLANKSRSPGQLAVNDDRKKRSGTNMFKAQRNRLVESVNAAETSNAKPNTAAWLEIEREKTLMQEEKLKLERERRQLEEEREKFEREKRMARLKQ